MNATSKNADDVDAYISTKSIGTQKKLKEIRRVILTVAPQAIESISYGMPAYKLHGKPIAYFAAFKNHIGFYATPDSHNAFAKELANYKQGKGSVQFPVDAPVPLELIQKMVAFNVRKIEA